MKFDVVYTRQNVDYKQQLHYNEYERWDSMAKRKQIFITKIKALRAEKNLTQQDLAIDLEVNRGTVLEIERGTFNPSLKLAFSIAKYFDKTVDEVFELVEVSEE